ncbi:MAG: arginine--tRNA ligase [Myxococcales bacterium]|nr:arginine--tRNA ligase [Myxococcales bacterium]
MKDIAERIVIATYQNAVDQGLLPAFEGPIVVEAPKQASHGDWSSNLAMLLAKKAGKPPRQIAQLLLDNLVDADGVIEKAEIAGPGFLNFFLKPRVWLEGLGHVLDEGERFGQSTIGQGRKVMVEYVSANPTGPMHVGHGRGAVVGDAIAALLTASGHEVTREYYINDAGGQVKALGKALYVRVREQLGHPLPSLDDPDALPYPGTYLIDVAKAFVVECGQAGKAMAEAPLTPEAQTAFTDFAMAKLLEVIKGDLAALNIHFDSWFSERTLHANHAIEGAIAKLTEMGHMFKGVLPPPKDQAHAEDYEPREQLLFQATKFGDDQDRPLQKSDGSYTYFAADIAYHKDKLDRGFKELIDVWGADHGGYVKRVQAAVAALTGVSGALDVVLVQMVNLIKDGKPYKMSKRAGTFVTLRDVVEEAGADATRVMFLMKRADAQLEFDLDLVKRQTMENPVFYVQYGHARCANIFKKAAEAGIDLPASIDLDLLERSLVHPDELSLVKNLLFFPKLVEEAARAREPHRVLFYVRELSAQFQAFYTRGKKEPALRVIRADAVELTQARLVLVAALKTVFANALHLLGVSAPDWMEAPPSTETEE